MINNWEQFLNNDFNHIGQLYLSKNSILLFEGLIHSFSYSKFIEKLKMILDKNGIKYGDIVKKDDCIILRDLISNKSGNFFNELESLLNISGYYVSWYKSDIDKIEYSNINIKDFMNSYMITYCFNKRFDFEDTGIKTILYHLTDAKYIDKIMKNGLVPRSKKTIDNHPDRIYLFESYEDLDRYNKDILQYNSNYKMVKLKIDVKKLPKLKLYKDIKYPNLDAYYTYDNIPPYSIEIIK